MVPDRLEQIPEHLRVAETFGHQGWIWGTCFLLTAVLFLLPEKGTPAPIVLEFSGGSAALGLALLGYEVWRRSHRTHLARQAEGLAVYRRGRFALLLSPLEVSRNKAGLQTMLRVGGGLGLAGLAFTAVGILELHRAGPSPDVLIILALGRHAWPPWPPRPGRGSPASTWRFPAGRAPWGWKRSWCAPSS